MKILIATGGSSHSEKALRFCAQLVQCGDEPPTVLTVVRNQSEIAAGEAVLQRARAVLHDRPCAKTLVRVGRPAEQILAEAREGRYNLIIVGERQGYTLKTRVLGSTASRVIEHAACPVLIVRGDVRPIRRILLCESGALTPSLHTRFTAQLADVLQGEEEITVLHVMSQFTAWPGVSDHDLVASAEELMADHAPEGQWLVNDLQVLTRPDIQARPKVRHGTVVEEIMAEIDENAYDLVVIGAHRDAGWQRVLLENIAREIIRVVDRPLLIVR